MMGRMFVQSKKRTLLPYVFHTTNLTKFVPTRGVWHSHRVAPNTGLLTWLRTRQKLKKAHGLSRCVAKASLRRQMARDVCHSATTRAFMGPAPVQKRVNASQAGGAQPATSLVLMANGAKPATETARARTVQDVTP